MNNKTYILLKDTPEAKAGTEFVYSEKSVTLYQQGEPSYVNDDLECLYKASLVENQPEWFKLKEEKVWTDSDMVEFAIYHSEKVCGVRRKLEWFKDNMPKAKMASRTDTQMPR